MGWVLASLGSAVLFAGVSVLDKRILAAHVPGLSGFYALVGVLQLAIAAVAGLAVPWEGASTTAALLALVSGVLLGGSLLLVFYALGMLEVSRVVPIQNTYPVPVAIMAVVFLGEHLSLVHWLAIALVVAGAGLVTVGQGELPGDRSRRLVFVLVFVASAIFAVAMVASKAALEEMDLWNILALRSLALGAVLLIPGLMPNGLRQARVILSNGRSVGLIFFAEGVLALAAMYTMLLALSLGPASLASTVMSTRPVFVLIISVLLSTRLWHLLDEPLTKDVLALKFTSTAMVVGGVSVLTLA